MKQDSVMGKLPYESPSIETCDFRVESGIAESFIKDDLQTANDFNVAGWWNQNS